jgi:hypothetical protein
MYILERGDVARILEAHMPRCVSSACVLNVVATTWVDMYHALFIHTEYIQRENEDLQMSAIKVGT